MIRRTDTFVSQPISTSIEPAEIEAQQIDKTTSTASEQPTTSHQGTATQLSEFNLQEQTTQAMLQNQLTEKGPGQITKDPDDRPKVIHDSPEIVRPTRSDNVVPTPAPAPAPVVKNSDLSLNSSGPEVEKFQAQLNQWRANQNPPLPPLTEKGFFGKETDAAVKDFQKTEGLKSDGIAGGNTKDRLTIENNPNFQKLNPDSQNHIRTKLNEFQKDPASRANLKKIATDPNLPNLSKDHQEKLLQIWDKRKDNDITGELQKMIASPTWGQLDDKIKTGVLDRLNANAKDQFYTNNLTVMIHNPVFKFDQYSPKEQEKVLNVFDNAGLFGRPELLKFMLKEINGVPAPLIQSPGTNSTALDQLDKLASSSLDSRILDKKGNPVSKSQVVEDLLLEMKDPKKNINGGRGISAAVVATTQQMAEETPGEYARLVNELATTGQATLADGTVIRPSDDAFREDNSGRSVGERLLQSAMQNQTRP
jgi:peptidoglycan hydrolase-like protein with peptidoglycan-binding domain